MKVKDLFDVKYGINLELNACEITAEKDGINFVSRTSENNGVVARVRIIPGKNPQPAGVITCAAGGSVMSSFVQNKPFYSGRDLYILTPKNEMTLEEKLFYCLALKMNAYRYQYGRQANKTLKEIELPEIPDWVKKYKIDFSSVQTKIKSRPVLPVVSSWKKFKISELFDVQGTKTTKLADLKKIGPGRYPYVTTQSADNGIAGHYNVYTEEGNVLTIDSAVAGFCAYQELPFTASDHVEKLIPKFEMNKFTALFLATIINRENYRYSYGRKFNQTKINETMIKLPADSDGNPDWQFIENYIKEIPYSDLI